MSKYKNLFGLIFLIILITSCSDNNLSQNDKFFGTWTRVGDNYARMKISVEKKDDNCVGKIIFLPTLAQKNGFVFNDVKWKNIKKINNNKYSLLNLDVTVNTFGDRVIEEYNKCFVYFISTKKIKLEFKNNNKKVQYWVKYQN
ncbi:MAG: hypothetical protein DRJ01_08235 [Bacteroidetes bacterium]|nr:MAG: hypothetical protein DRJ01_08235 [Bacteroidota bacterium]